MRSWVGSVVEVKEAFAEKTKRYFLLFILFIYLTVERLVGEPSNLLIDPLKKINIFFL